MDPVDDVLGWQRLDPRMLLVHPVRDIIRFLPAVIGLSLSTVGLETEAQS